MTLKHSVTATGTNNAGSQVSVNAWNADHLVDTGGITIATGTTAPTTPAAGNVVEWGRAVGGRGIIAITNSDGLTTTLQGSLGQTKVALWSALNTTALTATGAAALSATGTATAVTSWTSTNIYTSTQKVEYLVTVAAAAAVAGFFLNYAPFWRGNAAGLGGFFFVARVGIATGVTTATKRCFIGMSNSIVAPTDVNPSTLTNIIGVGYDAADTTWQLMFNAASTTTKVNTSITRPSADRTTMVEVVIYVPPNGTTATVQITDLGAGTTFTGSNSANIPANTTFLSPRGYASVGGTSSVVGIALTSLYIETPV